MKRKLKYATLSLVLVAALMFCGVYALILVTHQMDGSVTINASDGIAVYDYGTTDLATTCNFGAVDPSGVAYNGYITIKNLGNRPVMLNFEDDCPVDVGTIAWMQDPSVQLTNGTIVLQPGEEIGTDGTAPDTDQIRIRFTANPLALAGDYNFNIYVHAEEIP